jgi:hypothetical protein
MDLILYESIKNIHLELSIALKMPHYFLGR